MAKRHHIKANQKSKDLIQQITEKGNAWAEVHPASQQTTPDPGARGVALEKENRGVQPMDIDWVQGQEEQNGQGTAHSTSKGEAEMELAAKKQKIKHQKEIAAKKRKRRTENRIEEQIAEEAKKIERRRRREEGRLARRTRRETENALQEKEHKTAPQWTISDSDREEEVQQEDEEKILINGMQNLQCKHSHESQSTKEPPGRWEKSLDTQSIERVETGRKAERQKETRKEKEIWSKRQRNQSRQNESAKSSGS